MPFPAQLSSGELDSLRGTSLINPTYYASDLVIFCPNTVNFAARVNGAPTGASYAQVTFDTVTTGAYTDIKVGQTILIGSTSDMRRAEFTGVVRKAPTSTVIYINETSVQIPDNAYIWTILDYRLIDKLARQVGNTQYKFYDIPYQLTPPIVTGLQSAYAGIADAITGELSLHFPGNALPVTYGATISSWLWVLPSGITITSGTTTTQAITVDVDAGVADWITFRATDSNGLHGFFHFFVASIPADLSSVITPAVNGVTFSCNENGWTGSVTAFDGVDDILDNTLCVVLFSEAYNDEFTDINGAVKFVGRIRKENDQTQTDATYGVVEQTTYDLEGALAQFSRVEHLPFTLRNVASPTVWDELTNLTIWLAIAYTLIWHTNYCEIFSLIFDNMDLTYLYPLLPTQGGNIQAVIADLQVSIDATLESAATGETRVFRNALYQTTAQRNALTTVANYDDHDWIDFSLEVVEVDESGKVQASGGFFNNASGIVTPLLSLAPGIAQGTGANLTNFTRQVLASTTSQIAAQAELNTRAGNHYAIVQRTQPIITVTHPDGYTFITPSLSQWYTFAIAASENTGGRAFTSDDRWQCISYSLNHDSGLGTNEIQAVYRLESVGTPGQTVTYPAQGQIPPILPTIPPVGAFPSLPPLPVINLPPIPTPDDMPPYSTLPISANGNLLALISDIDAWNTNNALMTSSPTYNNISPAEGLAFTCFQWVGMGNKSAYLLGNDGSDSTLFFTEDGTIPNPTWVGTVIAGIYTLIRVGSTAGVVYLLGAGDNTITQSFLDGDGKGAWAEVIFNPLGSGCLATTLGTYNAIDDRFEGTYCGTAIGKIQRVTLNLGGASTVNSIEIDVDYDASITGAGAFIPVALYYDGVLITDVGDTAPVTATKTLTYSTPTAGVTEIGITSSAFTNPGDGHSYITAIRLTYIEHPAQTVYSTDFGATFASPVAIGASTTCIDTVKVGDVILAGAAGQVMKAVSGGAYSAYGSALPAGFIPASIWIPFKAIGSDTIANDSSNPDYVIAAAILDSATESMYLVTNSGTTFNAITPIVSAIKGLAVSSDCVTMPFKSGKILACILDYSGTRKLAVSTTIGGADTFTSYGAVGTGSSYIRYRRADTSFKQLFLNLGADGLEVSQNGGTSLQAKGNPSADAIIGVEVFG